MIVIVIVIAFPQANPLNSSINSYRCVRCHRDAIVSVADTACVTNRGASQCARRSHNLYNADTHVLLNGWKEFGISRFDDETTIPPFIAPPMSDVKEYVCFHSSFSYFFPFCGGVINFSFLLRLRDYLRHHHFLDHYHPAV